MHDLNTMMAMNQEDNLQLLDVTALLHSIDHSVSVDLIYLCLDALHKTKSEEKADVLQVYLPQGVTKAIARCELSRKQVQALLMFLVWKGIRAAVAEYEVGDWLKDAQDVASEAMRRGETVQ